MTVVATESLLLAVDDHKEEEGLMNTECITRVMSNYTWREAEFYDGRSENGQNYKRQRKEMVWWNDESRNYLKPITMNHRLLINI